MGLFNFKRKIKWNKDVMEVTDSLSNIWDSVINEMSDKMKAEQTEEVLRHFNIDMSELREFLNTKREPKKTAKEWKVAGIFDDFSQCPECGNMWPMLSTIEWAYCPVCGCRILSVPEPPKEEEDAKVC